MLHVASSDTIVSHRTCNNDLLEKPVKEQPVRSGFLRLNLNTNSSCGAKGIPRISIQLSSAS